MMDGRLEREIRVRQAVKDHGGKATREESVRGRDNVSWKKQTNRK